MSLELGKFYLFYILCRDCFVALCGVLLAMTKLRIIASLRAKRSNLTLFLPNSSYVIKNLIINCYGRGKRRPYIFFNCCVARQFICRHIVCVGGPFTARKYLCEASPAPTFRTSAFLSPYDMRSGFAVEGFFQARGICDDDSASAVF